MSVCVKVRMSKIMRMPIKVVVCIYVMYANCRTLPMVNHWQLLPISKFLSASGKLRIGKTLATNGEEITIAMIGNDVLANYW